MRMPAQTRIPISTLVLPARITPTPLFPAFVRLHSLPSPGTYGLAMPVGDVGSCRGARTGCASGSSGACEGLGGAGPAQMGWKRQRCDPRPGGSCDGLRLFQAWCIAAEAECRCRLSLFCASQAQLYDAGLRLSTSQGKDEALAKMASKLKRLQVHSPPDALADT